MHVVVNLMLEIDYASIAAFKFDLEGKIPGGKVSRRRTKKSTKHITSPWRPPIGPRVSISTIHRYDRLTICMERRAAAVGGASSKNWLISDTSRRIPFLPNRDVFDSGFWD